MWAGGWIWWKEQVGSDGVLAEKQRRGLSRGRDNSLVSEEVGK